MRAVKLLILVWSLAFGAALADYALGTSSGMESVLGNISGSLAGQNMTASGDHTTFQINALVVAANFMKSVLSYGLLLGTAAQALSPWPLPSLLTAALDGFSLFANALFLIEFIAGRVLER